MQRSFYSQNKTALTMRFVAWAAVCCLCAIAWSSVPSPAWVKAAVSSLLLFALPAICFWHFSGGMQKGTGTATPPGAAVLYTAMAALALQPFLQFIGTFTRDFLEYALPAELFSRLLESQALRATVLHEIVDGFSWGNLSRAVLVLAIIPAVSEELFFRGTLQRLLVRATHRRHVTVISVALAFATVHSDWFNFIPLFICSLFLGYSYIYSACIWIPVAFHFTSNLWNIILLFATAHTGSAAGADTAAAPPGTIPWWSALLSISVAILLIRAARVAFFTRRKKYHQ